MLLTYIIAGIFGLIMGSFLNVLIYRLPIMMQQEWRKQCQLLLQQPLDAKTKSFNLSRPRSHCPLCKKKLRILDNIPLLSFIFLKGKCRNCKEKIAYRYPIVEIFSAVTTLLAIYFFGLNWQGFSACVFSWALIAMLFIDIDHQLLPDEITLSLLWFGLLINSFKFFSSPEDAIWGAALGYLSLWAIGKLFVKIRKVEGIGYGDYKLLAAFGAWFGWQMLPFIVLIATSLGSIVGLILLFSKKIKRRTPIAFAPYLAIAGWIILFYGKKLMAFYFGG